MPFSVSGLWIDGLKLGRNVLWPPVAHSPSERASRMGLGGGEGLPIEFRVWSLDLCVALKDRTINKYYSYYLHLNSTAALSEGDAVSKGAEIGTMGQTGETSFTHLHFETRLVGCQLGPWDNIFRLVSKVSYYVRIHKPEPRQVLQKGSGLRVSRVSRANLGYCSYQFQFANNRQPSATSSCNTGFDPHVHPYLFLGCCYHNL